MLSHKGFRGLKRITLSAVILFIIVMQTGCADESESTGTEVELMVSAASSLADVLGEIKKEFERVHRDIELVYNFGASGSLAQQIEQGAQADLFISAGKSYMEKLIEHSLVAEAQHTDLLSNELAVIVPASIASPPDSLSDLVRSDIKNVAIGIPESVPAGAYAKEALTRAGLWEVLQEGLVQAKDVRQVLHYVETGNSDAGFVYQTDALSSSKVQTAFIVDPTQHSPILYPIGIIAQTKHLEEAEQFYEFLQSTDASTVFERYGFTQ